MRARAIVIARKRKLLLLATLFSLLSATQTTHVGAASTSNAQIDITSTVCVVDVVQDGTNQHLQAGSADCNIILPNLVTALVGHEEDSSRFPLPFAGDNAASNLLARPEVERSAWSPIASDTRSGSSGQPTMQLVAAMATGVGATVIATAIGLDVVLFEMHYSKTTMRWARERTVARVIKK
jgi:hypothetical protein